MSEIQKTENPVWRDFPSIARVCRQAIANNNGFMPVRIEGRPLDKVIEIFEAKTGKSKFRILMVEPDGRTLVEDIDE